METLTIEIRNPKARKLIEDLIDLDLIAIKSSWPDLWKAIDAKLPQDDLMDEENISREIEAYRSERA